REVLDDLAPASVDAIICDPPYTDEAIPLWSDLGAFAARVLKPGRVLAAYCGHLRQPETMGRLGEHLSFVWCGVTVQPGRHGTMRSRRIWVRHRPWLVDSARRVVPHGRNDRPPDAVGRGGERPTQPARPR